MATKFLSASGLSHLVDLIKNQFNIADKPLLQKITPYLYYTTYKNWDEEKAEFYFEKYKNYFSDLGACSSVRCGNYYGRNYDWYLDEGCECIVNMPAINGKHASIGVTGAGAHSEFIKAIAESKEWNAFFDVIPFLTLDGINDAGVVCNLNVAPVESNRDKTYNTSDGKPLCAFAAMRYILDYADSAAHAIELLSNRNIYSTYSETFSEEFHFMIADTNETYIIEFTGNQMNVIDTFYENKPIMTNFFLYGFDGNTSTAYYNQENFDINTTTLTPHAMGLERYDILRNKYSTINSVDTMRAAMKAV